jgi:hypothetical protein
MAVLSLHLRPIDRRRVNRSFYRIANHRDLLKLAPFTVVNIQ